MMEIGVELDSSNCTILNETTDVLTTYNLTETFPAALVIHACFVFLVIIGSLFANGLVLLLVAYDKRLQYRSILASLSVVVADILLILFYHVPTFASTVSRGWGFGDGDIGRNSCHAFSIISNYIIYVRWVAVGTIALDKFLTVRFPFRYLNHSKILLVVLTATVWLLPAVLVLPITPFTDSNFRGNVPTCLPSCKEILPCGIILTALVSLSVIWGAVLPSVYYTWMYYRGRKLKTVTHLGRLSVQLSTGAVIEQPIAVSDQQTREKRAFLTLFLLYISVLITSLPIYIVILTRRADRCAFFSIPIYVQFGISGVFLLSTFIDPLVLMRNQDFRQAMKKLFQCKSKTVVNPVPQTNPLATSNKLTPERTSENLLKNGYTTASL